MSRTSLPWSRKYSATAVALMALAQHGGLVACGANHHAAGLALLAQIAFQKLHHFTATFAHQGNHVHVGLHIAGQHAHQRTFAHARTGENAHALAFANGEETVDGLDAHFNGGVDAGALHGVGGFAHRRVADAMVGNGRPAIDRAAKRVDGAANQFAAHIYGKLGASVHHGCAVANALGVLVGHQQHFALFKANNLRQNTAPVGQCNAANIANIAGRAGGFHRHAHNLINLAHVGV